MTSLEPKINIDIPLSISDAKLIINPEDLSNWSFKSSNEGRHYLEDLQIINPEDLTNWSFRSSNEGRH